MNTNAPEVRRLIEQGAWVRLVKGAYKESAAVAYPDKADTDAAYMRLVEAMLSEKARARGVSLAVATHDDDLLDATLRLRRELAAEDHLGHVGHWTAARRSAAAMQVARDARVVAQPPENGQVENPAHLVAEVG